MHDFTGAVESNMLAHVREWLFDLFIYLLLFII